MQWEFDYALSSSRYKNRVITVVLDKSADALRNDRFDDRIIPIIYRPCNIEQLSWTLPTLQSVTFTRGRDAGYRQLFRIWKRRRTTR